jgi:hypothetical protein
MCARDRVVERRRVSKGHDGTMPESPGEREDNPRLVVGVVVSAVVAVAAWGATRISREVRKHRA